MQRDMNKQTFRFFTFIGDRALNRPKTEISFELEPHPYICLVIGVVKENVYI
jgi:hypothetical protein